MANPLMQTGLEQILDRFPHKLRGKRIGVLCHAASITSSYVHIIDALANHPDCTLGAVFGPQHGLFGQTQDNMVEWKGYRHPLYDVPVYSLYGEVRMPGTEMLAGLDALVVDLQDVGARPYTYIWTVKLCMQACAKEGIAFWILDRPNPIAAVGFDGPMLSEALFSFVGGAFIPLCHQMTIGEIALLMQQRYFPQLELNIVWMNNWWRNSLYSDTGLPWVLPSPNMPTPDTAMVYPGMVLLEATNMSEGRGTTRPFELFGAPYLQMPGFSAALGACNLQGCAVRRHDFIPTFQKWAGSNCLGMQIHVTDARAYRPVLTAAAIVRTAVQTSKEHFEFKPPPYEYEYEKMPFDILAGNSSLRAELIAESPLSRLAEQWNAERAGFLDAFGALSHYPENRA